DGYALLDANGQPLQIEAEGPVTISGDGTIFVNGQQAGQVGIAAFADPRAELTRSRPNTFTAAGAPTGEETGVVVQGYVEASNVNAALVMAQMTKVARHYEAAQQMVQNQDELLGRAISTLGRL
ncbi:MAG TPA: flagellar basal body rod C-terminal domain-containing protein, partial [Anaerolineales bacterium]|nr:flagellar basal body rod C-terminal domain-containing protein [Anaerolineales bacterium]